MRRGGKALDGLGVTPDYQTQPNSEYRRRPILGVSLRVITSSDKRERTLTDS